MNIVWIDLLCVVWLGKLALWVALQPEYVKMPVSEEEWLLVSKKYEELWNFPNCVGAIDGKHVVM